MKWKILLLASLALAACVETHDGTQVQIANQDCTACHTTNLTHPEDAFPLMSMGTKHGGIQCYDCHHFTAGPGIDTVHADCTSQCHLRSKDSFCCVAVEPEHLDFTSPTDGSPYAWDSTNKDFCLKCHPEGLL